MRQSKLTLKHDGHLHLQVRLIYLGIINITDVGQVVQEETSQLPDWKHPSTTVFDLF